MPAIVAPVVRPVVPAVVTPMVPRPIPTVVAPVVAMMPAVAPVAVIDRAIVCPPIVDRPVVRLCHKIFYVIDIARSFSAHERARNADFTVCYELCDTVVLVGRPNTVDCG